MTRAWAEAARLRDMHPSDVAHIVRSMPLAQRRQLAGQHHRVRVQPELAVGQQERDGDIGAAEAERRAGACISAKPPSL